MALKPEILKRIVALGGSHGPSNLELEPAMRSLKLPTVFDKEMEFSDYFDEEVLWAAEAFLANPTGAEEIAAWKEQNVEGLFLVERNYFRPYIDRKYEEDEFKSDYGNLVASEAHLRSVVASKKLEFVQFAMCVGGYPDEFHFCTDDPNPSDPTIYATDHETGWKEGCITNAGPFSRWLDNFQTLNNAIREWKGTLN